MHICGRSMVALQDNNIICGCGGIGRLIGFRFQRASVQVRVLSSAPNIKEGASAPSFIFLLSRCRTRTHSSGPIRWIGPATSSKTGGYNNFCPWAKMQIESCHPHQQKRHPKWVPFHMLFPNNFRNKKPIHPRRGILQVIFRFQKGILQRICSCNMLYRSL